MPIRLHKLNCALLLVTGSLFFLSFTNYSNKGSGIPVLKIEKLLSRIENNSDTLYIVNFWATWCKPCVAELPDFEKINTEFKVQKVKILLVSMDFKEDLKKKVSTFIKKNKYKSEVNLLDETDGKFIDRINTDWSGAIPATLFIKKGKKDFVTGKMSYELLKSKIQNY